MISILCQGSTLDCLTHTPYIVELYSLGIWDYRLAHPDNTNTYKYAIEINGLNAQKTLILALSQDVGEFSFQIMEIVKIDNSWHWMLYHLILFKEHNGLIFDINGEPKPQSKYNLHLVNVHNIWYITYIQWRTTQAPIFDQGNSK